MTVPTRNLLTALLDVPTRAASARALALHLGFDDLLFFVRDEEIGVALPALGLQQTLPQGRSWRAFLALCECETSWRGPAPALSGSGTVPALGFSSGEGTFAVRLGENPSDEAAGPVRELLPFLGATFRSERLVHAAQGHAQTARQAAQQSDILARRLDSTRAQLQSALIAAEAATRAKDEFLSVVSHELRTPLNSIYGWSEIMRLSPGDAAIYEQGLATIERNVKAQARLIDDILDVARITSGQMRLEMRPLELGSVIAAALDAVSPAASAKQLLIATDFIATDLDARADLVTGDFDRLQQIVWNLLSNAIKFTPLQGQIFVTCRAHEGQVELSVRDSGIGISAEFLPYVFERFQQADSTSTRRHGGLGLGMAITRHLVELHGGHIRVCSDGPNC
ncbi:MAG TPA: HAMP domain-containing sensor histidine kinase, partial [Abditibacterium sp.]